MIKGFNILLKHGEITVEYTVTPKNEVAEIAAFNRPDGEDLFPALPAYDQELIKMHVEEDFFTPDNEKTYYHYTKKH